MGSGWSGVGGVTVDTCTEDDLTVEHDVPLSVLSVWTSCHSYIELRVAGDVPALHLTHETARELAKLLITGAETSIDQLTMLYRELSHKTPEAHKVAAAAAGEVIPF